MNLVGVQTFSPQQNLISFPTAAMSVLVLLLPLCQAPFSLFLWFFCLPFSLFPLKIGSFGLQLSPLSAPSQTTPSQAWFLIPGHLQLDIPQVNWQAHTKFIFNLSHPPQMYYCYDSSLFWSLEILCFAMTLLNVPPGGQEKESLQPHFTKIFLPRASMHYEVIVKEARTKRVQLLLSLLGKRNFHSPLSLLFCVLCVRKFIKIKIKNKGLDFSPDKVSKWKTIKVSPPHLLPALLTTVFSTWNKMSLIYANGCHGQTRNTESSELLDAHWH